MPTELAKKIINLGNIIEQDLPHTNVVISELTVRFDRDELVDSKVAKVNKELRSFCRSRSWGFISHIIIDNSCLNSKGLHLSKKGVSYLAGNLNKYIHSN